MVRLQQRVRKNLSCVLAGVALHAGMAAAQQYLPDDPLQKVPEVGSAQKASEQSINPLYDFLHHSRLYKAPLATASLGINTLGEVPDSSWFTNRPPLSIGEVSKGARVHGGPQPPFTVVAAKTEGVTPGFRIKDGRGLTYFIKVDPQTNPEMATAADVMGALFLYAAGYNVPENYVLVAKRQDFRLSEKATFTALSGKKHPMTHSQLEKILDAVPVTSDGRVRAMASLSLSGHIIGPFRYEYTRTDDPNDLIPHDRRRDLRGLSVVFAWLNHTDAKGDNSMDTLQGNGQDARIVHHLLDFGDSFGSDSDIVKDPRHGQEFWLPTSREQGFRAATLGLVPTSWERAKYPRHLTAVGNFTATGFNPLLWKPNYPNQAFLETTPLDGYWGAKRVMSFSNEQIAAIVQEGQFSNQASAAYLTATLIKRRDLIGQAWFSRVAPLEDFVIADNQLSFTDLGQKYRLLPVTSYNLTWFSLDNMTGGKTMLTGASRSMPSELGSIPDDGFMGCVLTDAKDPRKKVTVVFRRRANQWQPVGIDRTSI